MANSLTEEQQQEIKKRFEQFDTSGNGSIEQKDLEVLLRSLGMNPSLKEIEELKTQIPNDNDRIDYPTVVTLITPIWRECPDEELSLTQAFDSICKDGDGMVSCEQLRNLLSMQGETLTGAEIDDLLTIVDIKDDKIQYSELVKALCATN